MPFHKFKFNDKSKTKELQYPQFSLRLYQKKLDLIRFRIIKNTAIGETNLIKTCHNALDLKRGFPLAISCDALWTPHRHPTKTAINKQPMERA